MQSPSWELTLVTRPNVETARAMTLAHREGRIDDMLELLHPEVHWRPMFRPRQALCVGREAVRQLVDDITAALGRYWFELDSVDEGEDGRVRLCARLVLASGGGGTVEDGVEFDVAFLDGLMREVVTHPSAPGALKRWDRHDASDLSVTTVRLGRVNIVVLAGELSGSCRDAVAEAVREAIESGRQLIQLECYGVDSTGPGALTVLSDAVDAGSAARVHVQVLRPSKAVRALIPADAAFDVVD